MAKVLFSNNAVSTLATYIDAAATSITLATGTGVLFPAITSGSGDYFYMTLLDLNGNFEIVKVTARNADVCTVLRAQEGTTAIAFPQGSTVDHRITAASLNDIISTVMTNMQSVPDIVYPIGSIYMSLNATNPAELFGGSWEKLEEGRVLIGANNTYVAGTKGGEYSHRLTLSEIPAHTHTGSTNTTGAHTHNRGNMNITGVVQAHASAAIAQNETTGAFYNPHYYGRNIDTGGGNGDGGLGFDASRSWTGNTSSNGSHYHSFTTGSSGGTAAHNIMQAYLAVHMWKRVA